MIKLLIVDDDSTSRSGITSMVAKDNSIEVIGSVSSGEEAISFCKEHEPDVILMDINMPHGISGLETAKLVRNQWHGIKILFLSLNFDEEIISGCPHNGYLLKESMDRSEKFTIAVNAVYNGLSVYSPEIIAGIIPQMNHNTETFAGLLEEPLTNLEMTILGKLVEGMTYVVIARELNYSEGYIRTTANKLMDRLNFKNVKELVVWGARRGM